MGTPGIRLQGLGVEIKYQTQRVMAPFKVVMVVMVETVMMVVTVVTCFLIC